MKKIAYIYILVLIFLASGVLSAQTAVPSSGGDAIGAGGSASFTVGQVVYTTNSGTNGSVIQGIQQPYEISVVTAIEKANDITLEYKAFPNPVQQILTLSVDVFEGFSFQLYDVNGKQLINKRIEKKETLIDMEALPKATYFLKVSNNKEALKTLKIIKN
tara:strand:- start:9363 stop:9842 length:480 start_codon:yes stop_codon:yes gene_type:complete